MSPSNPAPAVIDYYTDILCVWAWISQPRLDELKKQWGDKIHLRHRYVDIFGDSHNKILRRWGQGDGFEKFSDHVSHSAAPFEDTPVNANLWRQTRPHSSMPAHLMLKSASLIADETRAESLALRIRRAFFLDAQDVGQIPLLLELAAEENLDKRELEAFLRDGRAMAELSGDQHSAVDLGVKGSPTWVLNDGRQVLYGNVGYRILNANIEEYLKNPATEASWC